MKLPLYPRRLNLAFSILEVLIGVLLVMVMFVSIYLGFAQGFGIIQLARENLRATQIMEEKTETLRLYTWEQINSNGFIPTNFVSPFYAIGTQNQNGFSYYGNVTIEDSDIEESYASDLRLVSVMVYWTNGNVRRERSMKTFVARSGLQNYIY